MPPPEPFWSSLTDLKVEFNLGSPSGRWYSRGEPGDPYNVPGSADTICLMPPDFGSEEGTEAALEYDRLMRFRERRRFLGLLSHCAERRADNSLNRGVRPLGGASAGPTVGLFDHGYPTPVYGMVRLLRCAGVRQWL